MHWYRVLALPGVPSRAPGSLFGRFPAPLNIDSPLVASHTLICLSRTIETTPHPLRPHPAHFNKDIDSDRSTDLYLTTPEICAGRLARLLVTFEAGPAYAPLGSMLHVTLHPLPPYPVTWSHPTHLHPSAPPQSFPSSSVLFLVSSLSLFSFPTNVL